MLLISSFWPVFNLGFDLVWNTKELEKRTVHYWGGGGGGGGGGKVGVVTWKVFLYSNGNNYITPPNLSSIKSQPVLFSLIHLTATQLTIKSPLNYCKFWRLLSNSVTICEVPAEFFSVLTCINSDTVSITFLCSLNIGVRARSDLGGGVLFCPKKLHSARMLDCWNPFFTPSKCTKETFVYNP